MRNKNMNKSVEIRQTRKKGVGAFALRNFRKGETIFVNKRGRLVRAKDLKAILKDEGDHLNEIDRTTWEIMNPPGRFVNHSCDPNAISKESADRRVPYIALKSIRKGKEITADYRISAHTGNKWRCYCRSKNCKGFVISDFFSLSAARQRKYFPYTSKFIRDEYKKRYRK